MFAAIVADLGDNPKLPEDYKLTAVDGTTGQEAAYALASAANQVLIVKDVNAIVSAVLSGRATAAVVDFLIAKTERDKRKPGTLELRVLDEMGKTFSGRYGIAVRAGEPELLTAIKRCVSQLGRSALEKLQSDYGLR